MRTKQKGLNIDLTKGQYQMLHNLMCDAYDRGYDQRPRIDTQTFDNLFDAICNAKETYLWKQHQEKKPLLNLWKW